MGARTDSILHEVESRWTMAHAASIGDTHPCYLDTRLPAGVVAHPLFPVCLEWPAVTAARRLPAQAALTGDEAARGVHATHDLTVHRLVRAGDRLSTTAEIVGIEERSPGAFQTLRLETVDENGDPVCTTRMGSLFLDVTVDGDPVPAPGSEQGDPPPPPETDEPDAWQESVPVAGSAAHTYTECARIWNPIHTDAAVAERAGLPAPILHGTATLAMAVSRVLGRETDGNPDRVARITCRFGAMVLMPGQISVSLLDRAPIGPASDGHLWFEVLNQDRHPAVRDACITLRR